LAFTKGYKQNDLEILQIRKFLLKYHFRQLADLSHAPLNLGLYF